MIFSHSKGFVVADMNLKIIREVMGNEVKNLMMTGTNKGVLLGVESPQGQMSLWNLTGELDRIEEVSL